LLDRFEPPYDELSNRGIDMSDPMAMPHARFGWQYRTVDRFGPGDSIASLSLPGARIAVADLLP